MKRDLKKELKHLYSPSTKTAEILNVPKLQYLMIDGSGDPNTAQTFKDAMSALYSTAYTLKFALKKSEGIEYPVMPMEGLWWTEDITQFSHEDKANWLWTIMILQPDFVTEAAFEQARADAQKKKGLRALDDLHLASYAEGLSAQIMHLGSYDDEPTTLAKLDTVIEANGCVKSGKHHEIYLSDPTRTTPEKLRTIIRYPIATKTTL
jgi:hypothetical protein